MKKNDDKKNYATYHIYKFTNKIDNKIYIGQCADPERRKSTHKSAAESGSNSCLLFYRAIRKHGWDAFEFEVLESNIKGQENANNREIFWIEELNARNIGYNISKGGGGRGNPKNTDTHRQCCGCGVIKTLKDGFHASINNPKGKSYKCKDCVYEEQAERRKMLNFLMTLEEREEINAARREEYHTDLEKREKILNHAREDYLINREKYRAEAKERYAENREEIREKCREDYKVNSEKYKQNSKNDREKFSIKNRAIGKEQLYINTPFKECKGKCKLVKLSTEFYIDWTRPDGIGQRCKGCHKKETKIITEKRRKRQKEIKLGLI